MHTLPTHVGNISPDFVIFVVFLPFSITRPQAAPVSLWGVVKYVAHAKFLSNLGKTQTLAKTVRVRSLVSPLFIQHQYSKLVEICCYAWYGLRVAPLRDTNTITYTIVIEGDGNKFVRTTIRKIRLMNIYSLLFTLFVPVY